jgi:hypothetical protein
MAERCIQLSAQRNPKSCLFGLAHGLLQKLVIRYKYMERLAPSY